MSKMDIKIIDSRDIDQKKWSSMLSMSSDLIAQFNEYWYLNAIAEKWGAYVYGDYISAFPYVHKKRYGLNIMYQPFYSRSVSLLGQDNPDVLYEILSLIQARFSLISFNSDLEIKNVDCSPNLYS